MTSGSATPFDAVRPAAVAAVLYVVAAAVWLAGGPALPGGRWLVVHLFTLGVVTNVVLAFTQHFAATLSHQREEARRWPVAAANAAILAVLTGFVSRSPVVLAVGAAAISAVVFWGYLRIRGWRTSSLGTRFAFVLRAYERAHGAFLHGAVLGLLLGLGVLPGQWYGPVRLAHLHVNVLGWAGLTLLATLVFFGPTVLRVRIAEGADSRAAVFLGRAATALTIAVLAMVGSGAPAGWGVAARLVAAAALLVFTTATVVVCVPVLQAGAAARTRSASGGFIRASCGWFALVVAADAVIVATGTWRLLEVVGVTMLVAVLGQAIVAAVGYVAPQLAGAERTHRDRIRARIEILPSARPALVNVALVVAVAALAMGPSAGAAGAVAARGGFAMAGMVLLAHLGASVAAVAGAAVAAARRAPARSG